MEDVIVHTAEEDDADEMVLAATLNATDTLMRDMVLTIMDLVLASTPVVIAAARDSISIS